MALYNFNPDKRDKYLYEIVFCQKRAKNYFLGTNNGYINEGVVASDHAFFAQFMQTGVL